MTTMKPAASDDRFLFRLLAPLPALGGLPNDRVLVRPGHLDALTLFRFLPADYRCIEEAITQGYLSVIDPPRLAGVVAQLRALCPMRPGRRRGSYGVLQLVP